VIDELIERYALEPHPEGGFYRRVFEHPNRDDGRALASAIVYLLPEGVRSRWHRIDAVELWHAGFGASLELSIAETDTVTRTEHVGAEPSDVPMAAVPAGAWQSARTLGQWSLVTVTVVPAFAWEGFELAPEGWAPTTPE
jgi:predicted cupin superfamily sugar epimerase